MRDQLELEWEKWSDSPLYGVAVIGGRLMAQEGDCLVCTDGV